MELFDIISASMQELLTLRTVWAILLGVPCGLLAGALPGIGGAAALAILFPITYGMTLTQGIIFLLAIYTAAEYGGSIPAILIRTPGTGAAVATVLDGYPMARKGLARKALTISLVAGVLGSIFSSLIFLICAPLLAFVGLKFGPIEMFSVGVFGLSVICGLVGKRVIRGFFSASLGLFLATVGPSNFAGYRFTYDLPQLADGFPLVIVFIGFFAISEALKLLTNNGGDVDSVHSGTDGTHARDILSPKECWHLIPSILRGGVIGTLVGIIPGAGAGVASLLAYAEERRWSKRPECFGEGVEEGVAAPESANNAVVAGSLVPALALGVPGSAAAALIMGLLIMKGVTPGPMLFQESPEMTCLIFGSLIFIALVLFMVGYLGLNVFTLVSRIPSTLMGPITAVLILTGVYAFETDINHLYMALILGVLAYFMERLEIPTVPLVLAFIMGPIMEYYLNQALLIHRGEFSVIFDSPICIVILALSLASAGYGLFRELRSSQPVEAVKQE